MKRILVMRPQYYNINMVWHSDRKSIMCSPELISNAAQSGCIEVAAPLLKAMAGTWSPEHLFTASVASCFIITFLAIADNLKLSFKSLTCQSKGKMDLMNNKLVITEVEIFPTVIVFSDENRELAARVLSKTETACLISNSIKSRVIMHPVIHVVAETVKP